MSSDVSRSRIGSPPPQQPPGTGAPADQSEPAAAAPRPATAAAATPAAAAAPSPTALACPHCLCGRLDPAMSGPDPAFGSPGAVACPQCGHRAATGYVAEALWLQEEDIRLHTRLDWVRERIAAGDGPPPGSPGAPAVHPARHPIGIQAVLLGVGALLLVLAAVVFAAVAWDRLGPAGQIGILVVLVAALSAAAHALRAAYRSTAETLATIAAAVAAVALLAAPDLGLGADWTRDRPAAWAGIAFAVVALLALVMARVSRLAAWHVALVVALVAAAFATALAAGGGSSIAPLGCATLAVAAAAVLRLRPGRSGPYEQDAPWVGAGLALLAVAAGLAGYDHLDQATAWAGGWLVVAASAAALLLPVRAPAVLPRPFGPLPALVAGFAVGQALPLLAAGADPHPWVAVPALAACGAGLLAGTLSPRTTLAGAAGAVTIWVVALPVLAAASVSLDPARVSTFLGIVAISLLAMSFLAGRSAAVWVAAAVGSLALWVLLGERASTLEPLSDSSAALLLLAGLLHRRAWPAAGSLTVLGPALAMAGIPSALLALAQGPAGEDVLRAVLVIGGGAACAVLGATLRVRACLLVGLVAAVVAGLGQVLALADLIPRWVSLAVAGTLLVAAGFTAERLGRAGRHAWRRTREMW